MPHHAGSQNTRQTGSSEPIRIQLRTVTHTALASRPELLVHSEAASEKAEPLHRLALVAGVSSASSNRNWNVKREDRVSAKQRPPPGCCAGASKPTEVQQSGWGWRGHPQVWDRWLVRALEDTKSLRAGSAVGSAATSREPWLDGEQREQGSTGSE